MILHSPHPVRPHCPDHQNYELSSLKSSWRARIYSVQPTLYDRDKYYSNKYHDIDASI